MERDPQQRLVQDEVQSFGVLRRVFVSLAALELGFVRNGEGEIAAHENEINPAQRDIKKEQ